MIPLTIQAQDQVHLPTTDRLVGPTTHLTQMEAEIT